MWRAALCALLCAALLLRDTRADDNVRAAAGAGRGGAGDEEPPATDDDGDSAPFTLVVEHADGWRCSASLVSLRTAVTSAKCARGISPASAPPASPASPAPLADLWVHAPPANAPHSSRRVARIAFAAESETAEGAALSDADVAVLELEAALGGGARAILTATSGGECAPPGACHVVRARRRGPGARSRLRIVDEALVPAAACAGAARQHMLCLRGDTLCPSEWGAGVVCEGKLCGVVSGSAREEEAGGGGRCGALHAAAAAPRWRRFLHCAHTPGACARGGECAHLCSERLLLDEEAPPRAPAAPAAAAAPAAPAAPRTRAHHADARVPAPLRTSRVSENLARGTPASPSVTAAMASPPTRTGHPARAPPPPAPPASPAPAVSPPSARPAAEFEPNRPDFKAGEYGDNAAEYGGDEPASAPPPARPAPPTRSRPGAPRGEARGAARGGPGGEPAPRRELSARVSADEPPHSAAERRARCALLLSLVYFSI